MRVHKIHGLGRVAIFTAPDPIERGGGYATYRFYIVRIRRWHRAIGWLVASYAIARSLR